MNPLIVIAPVAAGLYFLFRKKDEPFKAKAPSNVASTAAAFAPVPRAPSAQSASDATVVDAAFAQFATEREFPIEEQNVETFGDFGNGGNAPSSEAAFSSFPDSPEVAAAASFFDPFSQASDVADFLGGGDEEDDFVDPTGDIEGDRSPPFTVGPAPQPSNASFFDAFNPFADGNLLGDDGEDEDED